MGDAHFERLSALDLSFLAIEDGRAHMHIGSVSLYEAAPLRDAEGGIDFERILAFVEAQLPKLPRYRQRLHFVPGFAQPVWVDDARFNLRFHVRHAALPPPGDVRQLKRLAGRILSQEFDRHKPLWETWIVEGVDGDRFAVIAKVHHAVADGISGVAMGNLLVGRDPAYRPPPLEPWRPRPVPSGARLVAAEMEHRLRAPFAWLRAPFERRGAPLAEPPAAQPAGESAPSEPDRERAAAEPAALARLRALLAGASDALRPRSETPLDVAIGPHRRFDWARLPFAEVKAIGRSAGGTLNDAVLAIASGALRRFLGQRGAALRDLDFRALVPVSVRAPSERASLGNRVSGLVVRLPLDAKAPAERLRRVVETTRGLKASGQSGAADVVMQAIDLLPAPLLVPLFRKAARRSAANVVITNVPGARMPVYLLGARQLETYPVVPLAPSQALGIALLSYDEGLFWGFNADWDAVPDLHELAEGVEAAFLELRATAAGGGPGREPQKRGRARAQSARRPARGRARRSIR